MYMKKTLKIFTIFCIILASLLSDFLVPKTTLVAQSEFNIVKVFNNIEANNISSIATYDNINFTYVENQTNTAYLHSSENIKQIIYGCRINTYDS